MADIADVTALLAQMTSAAVYPNGYPGNSVTNSANDVTISEGWPLQQTLDQVIAAGQSYVSIFPTRVNGGGNVFQVLNESYVIVPPVHGLTVTQPNPGQVQVDGTPSAGEYLTIVANGRYTYSTAGATAAAILASLAAAASAQFPAVSVLGDTIDFGPTARLQALSGSPATIGKATHRQRAGVMITVWAPNNALRNIVAQAIDVALKAVNRLTFPDTSQGLLVAERFEQLDRYESASIYRRDLCFTCEYATLQEFQAFEVTSFDLTVTADTVANTYVTG